MTAERIDGKAIAQSMRETVSRAVGNMAIKPGLAVVLVGEDAASEVYVRNKVKACEKTGIVSFHHTLSAETARTATSCCSVKRSRSPRSLSASVQAGLKSPG